MELDVLPQPLPKHSFAFINRPVRTTSGSGMVGMGVGDQRPRHRAPGVHPCIGGAAVQPLGGAFNHARTVTISEDMISPMLHEEESDFREPWARERSQHQERSRVFRFREAGVERFNDVYDEGYDDD